MDTLKTSVLNKVALRTAVLGVGQRPHQLLENANLSDQTLDIPSGWTDVLNAAGNVTYNDEGGYFSTTQTATNNRPSIWNSCVVTAGKIYTLSVYIHAQNWTGGNATTFRASGTSGTDGFIFHTSYSSPGWYGVSFQMGAADTAVSAYCGLGNQGVVTGTITFSRPSITEGLLPGVPAPDSGVRGTKMPGPPNGQWVGTDDGDEPRYL